MATLKPTVKSKLKTGMYIVYISKPLKVEKYG